MGQDLKFYGRGGDGELGGIRVIITRSDRVYFRVKEKNVHSRQKDRIKSVSWNTAVLKDISQNLYPLLLAVLPRN